MSRWSVAVVVGAAGSLLSIWWFSQGGAPAPAVAAAQADVAAPVPTVVALPRTAAAAPSPVAAREPAVVSAAPAVVAAAPLAAPVAAFAVAAAAPAPAGFDKSVAPVLQKFCVGCHNATKKNAGVRLDNVDPAALSKNRKLWEAVVRNVRAGDMPPPGKPKPNHVEIETMIGWIEGTLSTVDCTGGKDPGRVTIRRLNRAEYANTIRDLTGVRFNPTDDFPADDVGYGFDNIGDVLSLPPLLMEKYLAAGERIIEQALGGSDKPVRRTYSADEVIADVKGRRLGTSAYVINSGHVRVDHPFPADGEYVLRVRAYGNAGGGEPVKLSLQLDGKEVRGVDVVATEDKPGSYDIRLAVKAGTHKVSAVFANAESDTPAAQPKEAKKADPKAKRPRVQGRALVVHFIEIETPVGTAGTQSFLLPRQPKQSRRDWAEANVKRFATRAFRRPATKDETDRLFKFLDIAEKEGDGPDIGLKLAMQAVLVSPHFLFRVELDTEVSNPNPHPIGEFELASRLSYFLWSTMPDDELLGLAAKGELRKNLDAQVLRMLKDAKSAALVENFAGQWLQIRNMRTFAPDRKTFPTWDEELRRSMIRETELYFEHVMRDDRSILEFLDSDYTFVNERLARHYGIPGVSGTQFRKVPVGGAVAGQRGGVLSHGSILAITSNPTRTSPVKRGKWILEQLLGTPPPPAPPNVPELEDDKKQVLTGTLRQRMEQHRTNPSCAACHARMDPLGFGFENYDAVGAWRAKDNGAAIDPSGTLPSGQTFQGPAELKKILTGRKDLFAKNLAEKMLTFGLGRGLEFYDRCATDKIAAALGKNQYKFSTLVLETVKSDPFQLRQGATQRAAAGAKQ